MAVKETRLFWVVPVTMSTVRNIYAAAKERFYPQQFYSRTDVFVALDEAELVNAYREKRATATMDADGKRYVFVPKSLAATKKDAITQTLKLLRLRLIGGAEDSAEEQHNYITLINKIEQALLREAKSEEINVKEE